MWPKTATMKRRNFIRNSALTGAGFFIARDMMAAPRGAVYGHNGFTYRLDENWGKLAFDQYPVNDCHEMIQDKKGRIFLLTNETHNNVLIYNTSGKLKGSWGHEFPGAHGLTYANLGGEEFLWITDTVKHQVYKTDLDGKLLLTIDWPKESGKYTKSEEFVPTETTVMPDGSFYIADGYGAQFITQYDAKGKLLNIFGGRGTEEKHLDNAHGICIDGRNGDPFLLITDRTRNCFKKFKFDGSYIETVKIPGACVCRPVIHGKNLYAAVLRSPNLDADHSGFVTILDADNKVISNPGGSSPQYSNGVLQPLSQTDKIFVHPHDVCVDRDENVYVAQWNAGKVYPYKLTRV